MRKRLLLPLLTILCALGGVNSHAETIELNFGPSTTSGLPTNFATKETNVDFNGYTLTMYQTKWQKAKKIHTLHLPNSTVHHFHCHHFRGKL